MKFARKYPKEVFDFLNNMKDSNNEWEIRIIAVTFLSHYLNDEYIDKVYGQIRYYSLFGNTKNKMLDLMINKYQSICENESINFFVSIKTWN